MSASPPAVSALSQKRPLEEPSSPSGPTDQPEAKRPALDKATKDTEADETPAGPVSDKTTATATAHELKTEPADAALIPVENGTQDNQGDTAVPDAPSAAYPSASDGNDALAVASVLTETQPIQSTIGSNDRASNNSNHPPHQDESSWVHIRAVISSAEAATVIGKGGENVTQIRRLSGAKCTVSDYSRGAVERILTVSGLVDATAKVFSLITHMAV